MCVGILKYRNINEGTDRYNTRASGKQGTFVPGGAGDQGGGKGENRRGFKLLALLYNNAAITLIPTVIR